MFYYELNIVSVIDYYLFKESNFNILKCLLNIFMNFKVHTEDRKNNCK